MLFIYFTSLVDSYARSLQPPKDLLDSLEFESDYTRCLSKAFHRWEWINQERENKGTESNDKYEEHNSSLIGVDWYDFTIVETIPFAVDELLSPKRGSGDELKSSEEPIDIKDNDNSTVNIIEGKVDEEILQISSKMIHNSDGGLNILNAANYVPRVASTSDKGFANEMLDPISGCSVPVEQISNHMRIQLMDHKWNEQQKRFIDKQQDTGYAEGTSISDSLKSFARQRGDIFGNGSSNEVDEYEHNFADSFTTSSDEKKYGNSNIILKRKRK